MFTQADRALGIKVLQRWSLKLTSMLPKFKNKLETNETENRQKIKNSQSQLKILTGDSCRRVARILQGGGGLFCKLETTVNKLDPNFYQS